MSYHPEAYCRSELLTLPTYQPGKSHAALKAQTNAQIGEIIKLASNENLHGPSPQVIDTIRICADQVMLYPETIDIKLLEHLACHLKVAKEQIVIGNGSNEILELLGHAFLHQADAEVVFSKHAFLVYPLVAQLCSAHIKLAKPKPAEDLMPYGHDLKQMQQQISSATRLVFIANPNNPTGTWLSRSELADFLANVPDHCLVVIDQAYIDYADPEIDAMPLLAQFDNLVIVQTFSKAYGLAGLRIGYAVAAAPITRLLNSIRQPFNVNLLAQKAAVAALADQQHLQQSVALNRQERQRLMDFFDQRSIVYLPSQTNFLCVHFGNNSQVLYKQLLERGIIVRPIDNYDLPEHLRITIGQAHHNQQLINALQALLP